MSYGLNASLQGVFFGNQNNTLVGGFGSNTLTSSAFWSDGVWAHVAVTYDGTNLRLYGNGVLLAGPTAKVGALVGAPMRIGDSPTNGEKFKGAIDEPTFYTRALSAAEVALDYNSQKTSQTLTTFASRDAQPGN
jgi:hypothetical protein